MAIQATLEAVVPSANYVDLAEFINEITQWAVPNINSLLAEATVSGDLLNHDSVSEDRGATYAWTFSGTWVDQATWNQYHNRSEIESDLVTLDNNYSVSRENTEI